METTTQPTNAIARIVTQSGLSQERIDNVLKKFSEYEAIAAEWKTKAETIVVTNESQTELMKQAGEGRKFLKGKLVDIEKTRKEEKAASLNEGRFIDALAGAFRELLEPIRDYLEEQEKFAERQKAERERLLHIERLNMIAPYIFDGVSLTENYGAMPESQFNIVLAGYKVTYENKVANVKKVEEERIAKEEQDRKDREAQKAENERLRELAERQEREAKQERAKQQKILDEANAKAAAERKVIEEKNRREREKQDAILKAEREVRENLEREIKQKKEQEEKEQLELIEQKAQAELAPDKEKIKQLATDLAAVKIPQVKSAKAKKVTDMVSKQIIALLLEINNEMNKLK